jgi:hypothetical protein
VGQGLELEVLAAVILGGASLLGGSGTIFKTVIGVLILGFIQNGLLLAGPAVLRPVRRDLGHHHPRGLARYRHQARKALVADRLRSRTTCKPDTQETAQERRDLGLHPVRARVLFEVAGSSWSLSDSAFMDLDNMLLLLKQSAPIGIIALGMTIIMINGNIDLSSARPMRWRHRDARLMTWPVFMGLGRLGDPAGLALGAFDWRACWRADQRRDRVEDRRRRLHRHAGRDARLPRPRLHVQRREPDLPPELDAGRFRRGQFLGLQTPATWFLLAVVAACGLAGDDRTVHGRNAYAIGDNREAAVNAGIRVGPHMMINFHADRVSRGALGGGVLFRKRLGEPQ